jgi:hypothetical protein
VTAVAAPSKADETDAAATPAGTSSPEAALARRLERAGALYDERRLPEAELELDEALRLSPDDLRAWRLLARVRLRLGRAADARAAFAAIVARAPADGEARFELGLAALKSEDWAGAATELEAALRLLPAHRRVQQYLAYAWARLGRGPSAKAKAASPGFAASPAAVPEIALASLVADEMLPRAEGPVGTAALGAGVFRLGVEEESATHVMAGNLLAVFGELALEPAARRRPGRVAEPSADRDGGLLRCRGQGEIWVAPARAGAPLTALLLEDDVLYLRSARVVGFAGPLGWDAGAMPGPAGPAVLHFHGRGTVLAALGADELVSVRVSPALPVKVPEARVLGWMGDVVLQAGEGADSEDSRDSKVESRDLQRLVACEGEGVLLIARHGQAGERVHQRAEPGDDGAGRPDPAGPDLHR